MRYREIMQEEKLHFPLLYHCTNAVLSVGQVLSKSETDADLRRLPFYVEEVEQSFEACRPAQCLARTDSIFMSDKPDSWWGKHAYEVEPLGTVERNDHIWLDLAAVVGFDMDTDRFLPDWPEERRLREMERYGERYWSGAAASNEPQWEYRAAQAKVIQRVR